MTAAMHRIFIFSLWICACVTSEELSIGFEEEPASAIVKLGDRVRLRCRTNTPAEDVTWYFNDVRLTSSSDVSDGRPQRRKRNREDRLSYNSFTVQSDNDFDVEPSFTSRRYSTWRNDADNFSNPKRRRRRRKDRTRKGRRRKPEGDFTTLPTVKRYVRSVGGDSIDIESYGIQIRPDRLSIVSVSQANAGRYHCVVSSPGGSIRSKTAKIEIAEIHNFTYSPPATLSAYEGETVVIPCKLPQSVPPARARWKLNDVTWIDESSSSYEVLRFGSLLIRNATALGGNRFRCAAFNPVSEEIKLSSVITELTVRETDAEVPPRILYPLNDVTKVTHKVGDQVRLRCVPNLLTTSLVWNADTRLSTKTVETSDGLSFQAASSDSGSYVCSSSSTNMRKTYELTVTDIPEVVRASPAIARLGDTTTLECLSASALVWSWFYNGERVAGATDEQLDIGSEEELSAGLYQCFAENDAGSDSAIFKVTGAKVPDPIFTTSDEYFNATLDEDGIEQPTITRPRRTDKPTSYELTWISGDADDKIKLYSIKYYKTPVFADDGSTIRYESKIVNVPGSRHEILLNDLQPSSTYVVEMVAVNDKGSRSQLQISSFRTGEEKDRTAVGSLPNEPANHVPSPERPITPGKGDGDRNRLKVPRSPSRPTVTMISAHKISLMWRARGNGGSPIQGYRIQSKRVDAKESWKTIVKFISATDYPPYELTNIQRGAVYRFRVMAVNAAGDSKPSHPSEPHPKEVAVGPERLEVPPRISDTTTQGDTDIVITWQYDVPVSSIGGYYVYYRPSDSDDEDDYKLEKVTDATATSYVIYHLQPEMQYDIKIRAYNSLGQSPFSNVMIIEMPKLGIGGRVTVVYRPESERPGDDGVEIPRSSDYNDAARNQSYQRTTMFLISGAVIGLVLIVLLITVFCFWRKKSAQNAAETTPDLKQRNGYVAGKPTNQINMTNLGANGGRTPNGSASHTPSQHNPSPHDTRCQCSRHHSNHSSLGRDGMDYPPYPMPPYNGEPVHAGYADYPGHGNYPRIYPNPMRMYMDHRYPYFQPGLGRGTGVHGGPPIWWVRRENGEFCHIVPSDARKMSGTGEDATEVPGGYPGGGGALMMGTYDGNVTSGFYDDTVHRPDHGYHSNEDGTRTSSDSQAERSDEMPRRHDDEINSLGGATSGVVTLNDVTIESRSSSKMSSAKSSECERAQSEEAETNNESQYLADNGNGSDVIDEAMEDTPLKCDASDDALTNCEHLDENTNFLHKRDDERKETTIT